MATTAVNKRPDLAAFLSQKIPEWLADLAGVLTRTAYRQDDGADDYDVDFSEEQMKGFRKQADEYLEARENDGSAMMNLDVDVPPKKPLAHGSKRKGSSSDRSSKRQKLTPSTASLKHERLGERHAMSNVSSQAFHSSFNQYRAQHQIKTRYDGRSQKVLEKIVNELGNSRGFVWYAKQQSSSDMFFRRALAIDEEETTTQPTRETPEEKDTLLSRLRKKGGRRRASARTSLSSLRSGSSSITAEKTIEAVDRYLQQAQDACENAAYQLLRDGDCSWESKVISAQLGEVWIAAKSDLLDRIGLREEGVVNEASDEVSGSMTTAANACSCAQHVDVRLTARSSEDNDEDDLSLPPIRLTSKMRG